MNVHVFVYTWAKLHTGYPSRIRYVLLHGEFLSPNYSASACSWMTGLRSMGPSSQGAALFNVAQEKWLTARAKPCRVGTPSFHLVRAMIKANIGNVHGARR